MRALVISLHDVSPRTRPACARILADLAAAGVRRCSLLVIPDHHHRGHFLADAGFCAWLRELADGGHEIVMHGYFHQRARRSREGLVQRLMTRVYTADEGEFYDVDRAAAAALVGQARDEFTKVGLAPVGFIAPAWLLSAEAEEALRGLGVAYTTRLGSVLDVQSGRTWRSQSLVWSVRSAWRRTVSLGWNALLFRRLARHPLLRVSIHPVDVAHPAVWRQIRRLIARALGAREVMTYEAWLGRARTAASTRPEPQAGRSASD